MACSNEPFKVVFLRHGESQWNKENRFCGWVDVDLADTGVEEASAAAEMFKKAGLTSFDVAHTSVLRRAIRTLAIVQDKLDLLWIPVNKSWRLNERHYGGLQGLNKSETAAKHGEEQVKIWRRSYDTPPPPLDPKSEYSTVNDPKYVNLDQRVLPTCECLKDTVARVLPYWSDTILPDIKAGKKVIISAHGNSIRAIVKYLDNMTDKEIMELNIPTGIPLVYELDRKTLEPIKHYYLATDEQVKAAIDKVANQGKAK